MTAFSKRLLDIMNNGMLNLGLTMGHELKLFDAIASISNEQWPATSKTIAEKANMKERYVHEWLCLMACGEIVETDSTGQRFWIKKENVCELSGKQPSPLLVFQQNILMATIAYPSLIQLFKPDGPYGMTNSMFDEFDKTMAAMSDASNVGQLISQYIPAINMQAKLENGDAHVLDIGCGTGGHISELAKHFPKSIFTGIDFSSDAIADANKRKEQTELGNVSFVEMNAEKLDSEWTGKYDLVTIFDACHDQMRPDLSLKEVHRVLKADGLFAMFEVDGTGNVYEDRHNEYATFYYGISLMHCLPVGSNSKDALQLGAMWGRPKAMKLLGDAGFDNIQALKSPFKNDTVHVLYLCRK